MILQKRTAFEFQTFIKQMGDNRIAWHQQLCVLYMSSPDSHCVEAGSAASLWEYRFILIPPSGTTGFGLCAKNVMDFCSPELMPAARAYLFSQHVSSQSIFRQCLPGSYSTALCSLPLLFISHIYTTLSVLNGQAKGADCPEKLRNHCPWKCWKHMQMWQMV